MKSIGRAAFALLLQLVERQERQQALLRQQQQQQQQRRKAPRVPRTSGSSTAATQEIPDATGLPAPVFESLAPLAWALSRYGCCQPVLLDAMALLVEPCVAELAPTQALQLLEACTAVLGPVRAKAAAEGATAAGGAGGAGGGAGGAGVSGAEQLLTALVPIVTANVLRYSPHQAAQVAVQCAAARLYDEDLIRQVVCRPCPLPHHRQR